MLTFIISILVLGFLVILHEAGHFFVARRVGVRVLRFSIGFGPRLFHWKRGETEYAVSAIPLGGYVKMAGEQRSEQAHEPWEYLSKPVGTRAAIVFAGPLVNYLTATLCLWIVFMVGYMEPVPVPLIGEVISSKPAQIAGLKSADRIRSIDGKPVATWNELTDIIHASPNKPLQLLVEREGEPAASVVVTPESAPSRDLFGRSKTIGLIGIAPSYHLYRAGPLRAIGRTLLLEEEIANQTLVALWLTITGKLSAQQSMTGPIGIVVMAGEALRLGLSATLTFVGLISFSLALFNVFPIPILDGGHLLFLGIEALRRRPVSVQVQERAAQVSFFMLLAFVLMVCVNDVNRFGLFSKVVDWVQR